MNDPARHRRLVELFEGAMAVDPAGRAAWLDRECRGDAELRARVERLCASDADPDNALPRADGHATVAVAPPREAAGTRIDRYVVREHLGEGGFADVYLAEQLEPIQRLVALKIMKPGMDTKEVIARFEAERQALAMMDHVNVAKVFDAGTTGSGRPYFAMEHVPGRVITDHCDRHRLTISRRLEVFVRICAAVQHAHHKGIIHRDLKPSNVLVLVEDGEAIPKVIDFGVAKAIGRQLSEKTVYTGQGQLIGTPGYMSPEQAEMTAEDIDTRSDVYSLGVLLYELLAGSLPFDARQLREVSFAQLQRIIREQDPPRPSTKLARLDAAAAAHAADRRLDRATLRRRLRGDLDWIVMKAIEKDRNRRYASPTEFATDIARHLAHEPVAAGPPGTLYRAGKFVRRHRTAVAGAALIALALLAGTAGTAWGMIGALDARDAERQANRSTRKALVTARAREEEATRARRHLEAVTSFQASMLRDLDLWRVGRSIVDDERRRIRSALEARDASAAEIVAALATFDELTAYANPTDTAVTVVNDSILTQAASLETTLGGRPLVAATLAQTIGETYLDLGLYPEARDEIERALTIRRRRLGEQHAETLRSISAMGSVLFAMGRYDEAEPYVRTALAGRRRVLGDEDQETLASIADLGMVLRSMGRYDEAAPPIREALERRRRILGPDHPDTLRSVNAMGALLGFEGRFDEALPHYREALAGRRRVLGDDNTDTLVSMLNLGGLLQGMGRLEESEPYLRMALESSRRLHGDDHPQTHRAMNNLGALLGSMGRYADALPYYRDARDGFRRVLGPNHPHTLMATANLANALVESGDAVGGEAVARDAVERARKVLESPHWYLGNFLGKHGRALAALERFGDAEAALLEAHEILAATRGASDEQATRVAGYLVEAYQAWHAAAPEAGHDDRAARWRTGPAGKDQP